LEECIHNHLRPGICLAALLIGLTFSLIFWIFSIWPALHR
jgi:hypothetical protein